MTFHSFQPCAASDRVGLCRAAVPLCTNGPTRDRTVDACDMAIPHRVVALTDELPDDSLLSVNDCPERGTVPIPLPLVVACNCGRARSRNCYSLLRSVRLHSEFE